jgi:hypothetical protein
MTASTELSTWGHLVTLKNSLSGVIEAGNVGGGGNKPDSTMEKGAGKGTKDGSKKREEGVINSDRGVNLIKVHCMHDCNITMKTLCATHLSQ